MSTETASLPVNDDFVRATSLVWDNPSQAPVQPWRTALKTAVRSSTELLRILRLANSLERLPPPLAESDFPVFAPHEYIARMSPGDPHDPLLRQVLATADEDAPAEGYTFDPVGDHAASPVAGLVRKYRSRALFVTTGACAIHCRYCFRRHFPYETGPKSIDQWQEALDEIALDPQIDEVILSGGDPLTLVDEFLAQLAERIAAIDHVKRLRIHTRLPIVIPQRVTSELLGWLRGTRLVPIMVVHANHPHELDGATSAAIARLVDAGVPVLNQAVLLRGVNDDAATLIELCRKLVDLRAMPYYLHQLDRVHGAAHFEVPVDQGLAIVDQMRAALPGYAMPRYVQEIAGDDSKRVIVGINP